VARFLIPAEGMSPGWDGDWHSVVVRSFWAKADLFTFGMALAVVCVGLQQGLVRLPDRWPLVAVTYAAVLGIPEEWSRVVDRSLGMITRRLPDPALVARSAPPS
jgi:hypothetical protein